MGAWHRPGQPSFRGMASSPQLSLVFKQFSSEPKIASVRKSVMAESLPEDNLSDTSDLPLQCTTAEANWARYKSGNGPG